ncbi:PolC-type DNA polymerase III [Ferviditalea candida]|uniref:DNA polymerase III PolC-type n=1 Tax=Ferviditalea candida TaxID=3108399 RepID=A0ABU5ZF46_9BACL|nr:PolC-type DNA polymerase III [Paenibacillaceae bacterium T2]
MSNLAEKRNRFELLMQQAQIPTDMIDSFFSDGYIEKVECSRSNREWTFYLHKDVLLPSNIYSTFLKLIQTKFSHIAEIRFVVEFSDRVTDQELVEGYWDYFIQWVQQKIPSVNGWLSKAAKEVSHRSVRISLLDSNVLELAYKKKIDEWIQRFFSTHFRREYRIDFSVSEDSTAQYEQFAKQIEQEERTALQEMMSAAPEAEQGKQAQERVELMMGYVIKEDAVPIQNIQEEEKRQIIQGTVFALETKELKNGSTLFQFNVTDFTDSISVKCFARSKDDVKVLSLLENGKWIKLRGKVEYDKFLPVPELVMIPNDINEILPMAQRSDNAETKRVEFHLHTNMSTMDAISSVDQYIKTAAKWGHKAIAVTDHGGVQAFPEAHKAEKKYGIKVIYGLEANVVNDSIPIVMNPEDRMLADAEYVVFDVETTGLSVLNSRLIEIAGVKMKEDKVIDRFASFVNPHQSIPYNITQLTNITDDMVKDAPEVETVIPQFIDFIGNAVLVAHNARFDMGFLQAACKNLGLPEILNPVLDTLELARFLYPSLKNHRLNTLADKLKVSLENHHRAIDDAEALGHILFHLIKEAGERNIVNLASLNDFVGQDLSNARPFHCTIYARNLAGKKNLFKLVSLSHTDYFLKVPRIPKSKLAELREGLIISSGCEKGEFFETVLNKSEEEAEQVAEFYDVLEIQPIGVNMHLVEKGVVPGREQLEQANLLIVQIGRKLNKPVIATGNVHYLDPYEKICRDITIHGITGFSPLKDIKKPDVHLRTTEEMLQEFAHLGEQTAFEVVVSNTDKLADEFESFEMFPKKGGPTDNGLFSPIIEGADEEIRTKCYDTASRIYGEPLPEIVVARLEKELAPIIKYGFSANYLISERLVKKSNEDGYLVGSRGSVGSSFVATMLGISEVNPLPAHYICGQCRYSEWFTDGSIPSGFDLEDKDCPKCGSKLKGEGQDIPFETFLGFKGDKVPDIDLNFSGEYQPHAHNYTKVLFGEKNVFRAGTIGTVAEKTAYGFVKKFEEDHAKRMRNAEASRLAAGCTGVKRSTGQHPGGIVVVPDYIEVEDITPVQYPADDTSSEWKTTHFDYHAFDANLLKLDILGHDDPTMMRMLQDLTDVDPTTIPMNDPEVMSIFSSTEALKVTPEQIRTPVATYGIPEMGTKFVRQMLQETVPKSFADLLQISGLSHGTGVWLGNAQELIRSQICTIKTVIGCRDDIMLYLIYKAGMEAGLAFQITESVRKGKGLKDEWIVEMKNHNVPQWYIDSCQKIEYMFPKAHAAAYVISAVRTAYYKVYHPIAFYATYFSVRGVDDFDVELFCRGYDAIFKKLVEIEDKGFQATAKEKGMISILEMALEMTARGFSFKGIDLYRSAADRFIIDGDALIPPFAAIPGIGVNAAKNIAAAREAGDFLSVEDFQTRAKASKTVVEILGGMGCFRGMPESNQLSLF